MRVIILDDEGRELLNYATEPNESSLCPALADNPLCINLLSRVITFLSPCIVDEPKLLTGPKRPPTLKLVE